MIENYEGDEHRSDVKAAQSAPIIYSIRWDMLEDMVVYLACQQTQVKYLDAC